MTEDVRPKLRACRLCAERFAATQTQHRPNPVVWFSPEARLMVAGQAPGMRVHKSNTPFLDRSGDRLRDWMGIDEAEFYDKSRVAVVPSAFCFPGYNAKGADLPPPPICAQTWHPPVLAMLPKIRLRVLVGGYSHRHHLGITGKLSDTVARWRDFAPDVFVLPHPSWRNNGWLKQRPWFEDELLPVLKTRVRQVLDGQVD